MAETSPGAPAAKPAVPAVNVSPSLLKPPAPPAPVAKPPEAAPPAPKPSEAETLEAREKELQKAHARIAKERRDLAEERKKLKSDATQATEYEAWKKEREDWKRNPAKHLKALYGEGWYDTITRAKLEGAPPADLIASELDERTAQLQKQLEDKHAALEKRLEDMRREEETRQARAYLEGAKEYVKSNAEKFALLNSPGLVKQGSLDAVAQEIQSHFQKTCKKDEDGNWLPGETLTPEQAAENVEKRLQEMAEAFRPYLLKTEKPKGTTPEGRSTTTPRSESPKGDEWTPPKDESERRRRAFAAADESLAKRGLLPRL